MWNWITNVKSDHKIEPPELNEDYEGEEDPNELMLKIENYDLPGHLSLIL